MLLSMTGFGNASTEVSFGKVTIEMQSVNRKHLDIQLFLPKELNGLDPELRGWIGKRVGRGQITLRLHLMLKGGSLVEGSPFFPNLEELRGLKQGWERLAVGLGLNPNQIDLSFLLLHASTVQHGILLSEEEVHLIHNCLNAAIDQMMEMKKKEGAAIAADFQVRLRQLETMLSQVEQLAPNAKERMRQKYLEKMESLAASWKGGSLMEQVAEQMARELFFYAEKVDIAEEMTRLKSHFRQMETIYSGKKIEFLLQEMGREVNTMGSKVSDSDISYLVIEMKGELEKMREQVQNVE